MLDLSTKSISDHAFDGISLLVELQNKYKVANWEELAMGDPEDKKKLEYIRAVEAHLKEPS